MSEHKEAKDSSREEEQERLLNATDLPESAKAQDGEVSRTEECEVSLDFGGAAEKEAPAQQYPARGKKVEAVKEEPAFSQGFGGGQPSGFGGAQSSFGSDLSSDFSSSFGSFESNSNPTATNPRPSPVSSFGESGFDSFGSRPETGFKKKSVSPEVRGSDEKLLPEKKEGAANPDGFSSFDFGQAPPAADKPKAEESVSKENAPAAESEGFGGSFGGDLDFGSLGAGTSVPAEETPKSRSGRVRGRPGLRDPQGGKQQQQRIRRQQSRLRLLHRLRGQERGLRSDDRV